MGCDDIRGGRRPRYRDDKRMDRGTPPGFPLPMIGTLCGVEDYVLCVDVPAVGRLEVGRPWPLFGDVDPPYETGQPIIVCPLDRPRRMHPALTFLPIVEFYDCSHSCRCPCNPPMAMGEALPWGWYVNEPGIIVVAMEGPTGATVPWGWEIVRPDVAGGVAAVVEPVPLPWGWTLNSAGIFVGSSTPGTICAGELVEEFDDDGLYADLVALTDPTYEIGPVNLAPECSWLPPLSDMLNIAVSPAESEPTTSGFKFVLSHGVGSGEAHPSIADVIQATSGEYEANKLMMQELDGFAGKFGDSFLFSAGLFRLSSANTGAGVAVVFFDDVLNHFSIRVMDSTVVYLVETVDGVQSVVDSWDDPGDNNLVYIGVWRDSTTFKVAAKVGAGDPNSPTFWNTVSKQFVDFEPTGDYVRFAIAAITANPGNTYPQVHVDYLCGNTQRGLYPPWDPP